MIGRINLWKIYMIGRMSEPGEETNRQFLSLLGYWTFGPAVVQIFGGPKTWGLGAVSSVALGVIRAWVVEELPLVAADEEPAGADGLAGGHRPVHE